MERAQRPTPNPARRPSAVWLVTVLASLSAVLAASTLVAGRSSIAAERAARPQVQAAAAVVMDERTGVVVYAKDAHRRLPMASCTKIMTALIVLERIHDRSRYVTVPAAAVGRPGASIGLRAGDRITVHTLLAGMLTRSATDCAITLATAVAGDEPAFVKLMNRRAAALGLDDTHYPNCAGLASPSLYTSAVDLARLGRRAMRLRAFRDLVRPTVATLRWPPDHVLRVESHNVLNRLYRWVDGIKTGSSVQAKRCLASSGTYGQRRFIVTTLREPTRSRETSDHVDLYQYAASLYDEAVLVRAGTEVVRVPLEGGGEVSLVAATTLRALKRTAATVKIKLVVPASFATLPDTGTVAGKAGYWADGERLAVVDLVVAGLASPSPSPLP
jgi:serine-type D-Ala-D-Ala carboxypeptidase (penicillin-binding protein 5/6)